MKLKTLSMLGLAAGLWLFAGALAHARSDASFMKQAAENGHAEVEASKLAQSKAVHPEVKNFANKMVTDHTQMAEELKQLAASKNVELPTEPSLMQKGKLKLLSGGSDAKFDERYSREFGVKAHEDTLKLFQTAASESRDADVKAFAQKAIPSLQGHLEMARKLPTNASTTAGTPAPNQVRGENIGNAGIPAKH